MPQSHQIELGGSRTVTAQSYAAAAPVGATLVLGHGAGANQQSEFMTGFAIALAERGLDVVTFNFPFTERGRKLPDPQPVLEACFRAVIEQVATWPGLGAQPLFIGGKSLGGRMASHVAAAPDAGEQGPPAWWGQLRGLVFLGYPLHPPGRPQQVRVSHLARVTHPMLFIQGERDAFGTPQELRAFVDVLSAPCTLHAVPHGGHSLDVPKRLGVPQADIYAGVQDTITGWILEHRERPRV